MQYRLQTRRLTVSQFRRRWMGELSKPRGPEMRSEGRRGSFGANCGRLVQYRIFFLRALGTGKWFPGGG